uniref:Uncharacterized protein n=1 Tax=Panagrolaimus davidi TaxID=227884 RepID=A0A914PTI2_9BILA
MTDLNGTLQTLQFAKGMAQASLSKEAVDYIFDNIDLTIALSQFNDPKHFANDENLIPTLLATDVLGIPGSFFHRCIDEEVKGNGFFTRSY